MIIICGSRFSSGCWQMVLVRWFDELTVDNAVLDALAEIEALCRQVNAFSSSS
jgi:hypothetical protein